MPRKKIAQFRAKKENKTTLQTLCQENKNAQIQAKKKLQKTIVQTLCQGKKMHKFQPKKHLTLPYKRYDKKLKITNFCQKSN